MNSRILNYQLIIIFKVGSLVITSRYKSKNNILNLFKKTHISTLSGLDLICDRLQIAHTVVYSAWSSKTMCL